MTASQLRVSLAIGLMMAIVIGKVDAEDFRVRYSGAVSATGIDLNDDGLVPAFLILANGRGSFQPNYGF
jgi:hypothetical protein